MYSMDEKLLSISNIELFGVDIRIGFQPMYNCLVIKFVPAKAFLCICFSLEHESM